jgi:uncharacterized protein
MERRIRLVLSAERSVTAVWSLPEPAAATDWAFVYAPGAGAKLNDGFGVFAAKRLLELGIATLRFQFPYAEEGRRVPDRPPVLEATWRQAIGEARGSAARLVVGGRSMGGRIASQVVAQGEDVNGLALFAYPLHPPGQPERLRAAHLPQIAVPTLFCSGTNDAFATPEELHQAAALVSRAELHFPQGADHSFRVAKASGRTQQDVWNEAVTSFVDWLKAIN